MPKRLFFLKSQHTCLYLRLPKITPFEICLVQIASFQICLWDVCFTWHFATRFWFRFISTNQDKMIPHPPIQGAPRESAGSAGLPWNIDRLHCYCSLLECPSNLGSMLRINGLFHLLTCKGGNMKKPTYIHVQTYLPRKHPSLPGNKCHRTIDVLFFFPKSCPIRLQ